MAEKKEGLEQKLDSLEKVINDMEKDGITLEKAFSDYQKGIALVKECMDSITEVEGKILKIKEDGSFEDFN